MTDLGTQLNADLGMDCDLSSGCKVTETSLNGPLLQNGTLEKSAECCKRSGCACKESDEDDTDELLNSLRNSYNELLVIDDSELEDKDKLQLKLKTLQRCFHQLIEENGLLLATVSELEREAGCRVQQMEARLRKSARSTMEAVLHIQECEEEMRRLVMDRLHVESVFEDVQHQLTALKVENGFLSYQNANLHHDIDGLLHIIQQARTTGNWEMDSMTFCEVTPEQVFGPIHSVSQRTSQESINFPVSSQGIDGLRAQCDSPPEEGSCSISNLFDREKQPHRMSIEYNHVDSRLQEELNRLKHVHEETQMEISLKDKLIATLESQITALNHELTAKEAECERHLLELSEHQINENSAYRWENVRNSLLFNSPLSPRIRSEPHLHFLNMHEDYCKYAAKEKQSIGVQTDDSARISRPVQTVQEESRILCTVPTQTDMTEVLSAAENESKTISVIDLQQTLNYYREQVQKAEDKALSKEILVNQLQSHIQTTLTEVELKDKTLSNLERKLDSTRQECATLREQITKLNGDVDALKEQINEKDSATIALKTEVKPMNEVTNQCTWQATSGQPDLRSVTSQLDRMENSLRKMAGVSATILSLQKSKVGAAAFKTAVEQEMTALEERDTIRQKFIDQKGQECHQPKGISEIPEGFLLVKEPPPGTGYILVKKPEQQSPSWADLVDTPPSTKPTSAAEEDLENMPLQQLRSLVSQLRAVRKKKAPVRPKKGYGGIDPRK